MRWILEFVSQPNKTYKIELPGQILNEEENLCVIDGENYLVRYHRFFSCFFIRKKNSRVETCLPVNCYTFSPKSGMLEQDITLHFAQGKGLIKAKIEADLPKSLLSNTKAAPKEKTVTSPLSGKLLKTLKREGDPVKAGEAVVVIEAMKMENQITAPNDGEILAMHVSEGMNCSLAAPLFTIKT